MWHWQKATQRYMHNNKLFNGKTYRLRVLKWHNFFIILFKCFYHALFMTLVEPKEIDHCRFPIPKNGREFWNTKIRTAEPTCSFLIWFCCSNSKTSLKHTEGYIYQWHPRKLSPHEEIDVRGLTLYLWP